jgi:hypothetical protein
MKKTIRLTESELVRLARKVIKEQSSYDGDPIELYKMYSRMIESEIRNINHSIEELSAMKEDIMMNEDLNEEDKNDLESEIDYFISSLGL